MNDYSKVKIFFAYAREDTNLRDRLEKHLTTIKRQDYIDTWFDGLIEPGKEWEEQIVIKLHEADIVLALISVDFISSDYCYEVEMKKAMERHEEKKVVLLPIILSHCDWKETSFSNIQVLPENGNPVISEHWISQDKAFAEISNEIKKVVKRISSKKDHEIQSIKKTIEEKRNELNLINSKLETAKDSLESYEARNNDFQDKLNENKKLLQFLKKLEDQVIQKNDKINQVINKNNTLTSTLDVHFNETKELNEQIDVLKNENHNTKVELEKLKLAQPKKSKNNFNWILYLFIFILFCVYLFSISEVIEQRKKNEELSIKLDRAKLMEAEIEKQYYDTLVELERVRKDLTMPPQMKNSRKAGTTLIPELVCKKLDAANILINYFSLNVREVRGVNSNDAYVVKQIPEYVENKEIPIGTSIILHTSKFKPKECPK